MMLHDEDNSRKSHSRKYNFLADIELKALGDNLLRDHDGG